MPQKSLGPLRPIWRFFGADEPNYATMPNGKKLLGELGELAPESVYFRTHNLLTSGDGTPALKWGSTNAYREDARRQADLRLDDSRRHLRHVSRARRPALCADRLHAAGSVDEARAVSAPVEADRSVRRDFHRLGVSAEGLRQVGGARLPMGEALRRALRRRRSRDLVLGDVERSRTSPIGRGRPRSFASCTTIAIAGVRRALPNARVGGPDTAGSGGDFTRDFLEHCLRGKNYATGEIGTPLDFISFHAKGAPRFVEDAAGGHVRMGIAEQLRTIDDGFKIVASFPELKKTPIVIGESDPEGCAACQGPQLAYRNGTMYSSYTAASFARKHDLAARHGVNLEGALTWAFEFEDQPYFAGFRSLATNGIDKPVLNVFRMFAKMSGERLAVESDGAVSLDAMMRRGVREKPDVSAFASRDGNKLYVMVWHYHDDDLPGRRPKWN